MVAQPEQGRDLRGASGETDLERSVFAFIWGKHDREEFIDTKRLHHGKREEGTIDVNLDAHTLQQSINAFILLLREFQIT